MTQTEKLPMSQRRYRRIKGARCPFCGSPAVRHGESRVQTGTATCDVSCEACGQRWTNRYEITGYREKP